MTREEAIKALKWFKEYNEEDYCGGDRIQDEYGDWYYKITEQDFEAFDMAIKALEQIPKLQNRCYALTYGQMCIFCPYECEHKTEGEG